MEGLSREKIGEDIDKALAHVTVNGVNTHDKSADKSVGNGNRYAVKARDFIDQIRRDSISTVDGIRRKNRSDEEVAALDSLEALLGSTSVGAIQAKRAADEAIAKAKIEEAKTKSKDIHNPSDLEMMSALGDRAVDSVYLKQVKQAVKKRRRLLSQINNIKAALLQLKSIQVERGTDLQRLDLENNANVKLEKLNRRLNALRRLNSSAFTVMGIYELKRLRTDAIAGKIVETEYVAEQLAKVEQGILQGKPIFIKGPPDTGKTELAKHAATKIFKLKQKKTSPVGGVKGDVESPLTGGRGLSGVPYYIVSGQNNMDSGDIAGRHAIKQSVPDTAKMIEEINAEVAKYMNSPEAYVPVGPNRKALLNKQRDAYHKLAVAIIAPKYQAGTITDFDMGPIYKAMEQGVPLIIDEANTIPQGVLILLNDILTKEPGDTVTVQEDGGSTIIIKKGFCIISTGNTGPQYKRNPLESAWKDRQGTVIDYEYLPNAVSGGMESGAKDSQLWHMMLAQMIDSNVSLTMNEGDVEEMWRLSKAIRFAQDVFEGKDDVPMPSANGGRSARTAKDMIKTTAISNRLVMTILEAYKANNMQKSFEDLLMEKFIIEKTNINEDDADRDSRAAYLEIFKKCGYFIDPNNPNLYKSSNYNIKQSVDGKINIKITGNTKREIKLRTYSSREVTQFAYGKAPSIKQSEKDKMIDRYEQLLTPGQRLILEKEKLTKELARLAQEAADLGNRMNNPRPLPNPLHKGGGQPDTQPTTPVPTSPDPLWSHPDIQSIMDKELVKGIAGEVAPGIISLETKDYKGKTATELLDQGKYDTVENYPKQYDRPEDKITTDSLEITFLNPTKSRKTADIKAEMHRLGVRPLNAHELYALGIKYPELQRKQAFIALGSAQTFGGDIHFPCLWGFDSGRLVFTYTDVDGWSDRCRFPVVRK